MKTVSTTSAAATVAATTAMESLAAATRCLNVVNAAARGMPLARSQLSAISTVHRLAGAVTKAAEKLAFEAAKISANPIVGRETPILSATFPLPQSHRTPSTPPPLFASLRLRARPLTPPLRLPNPPA